jgi:hypothetical protein
MAFGVLTGFLVLPGMGTVRALAQTQQPLGTLNFYGGGTRAHALGGAFLGLSDDGSASTWNPAGLTQNDRIFTAIDWGIARQEVTNTLESPEDLSILYDNTSSENITHFNFLSFNGPLTLKGQRFHFAAAWNRANYESYEAHYTLSDLEGIPIDVPSGATVDSIISFNRSLGGPEFATLAMATQLKEEKLSIGFGLNIYTGNRVDSAQSIFDGEQFDVDYRVVSSNLDDQDYSGVNFNFGALFQASQVSVGLTVKTPFKLETQHDAREASATYERTSDSVLLITENSVLLDYRTQIGMPLQLGLGFAYRPQENLILAADYEYKGFSNTKVYNQADRLDPKSELVEMDPEYKDVHQVRFGVEYQVGVGWGVVPVRAGFRTEPMPYSHRVDISQPLSEMSGGTMTASQGDQVVGEVYSLGTGVQWRQVRFDVAWELSSVTQYSSGYFNNTFLMPQFIATRENHVQRLSLGFTGYF